MSLLYLPNSSIVGWVNALLAASYRIIAPVISDNKLRLGEVKDGSCVSFVDGLTTNPAKEALFPQTQTLFRFNTVPDLHIQPEAHTTQPCVLFGVRACDAAGLGVLDQVLLKGEFQDSYYTKRRQNTIVVTLGCLEAKPTCFCSSMGVNFADPAVSDITLFPIQDGVVVDCLSPRGQELLESLPERPKEATVEQITLRTRAIAEFERSFSLQVSVDQLPQKLEQQFEAPLWQQMAYKCLGCGICTFNCPTCHCFDIQDDTIGSKGRRLKCWDSCMNPDFTRMAGGHNPRPGKRERVRQRFMHKLSYFPTNHGRFACVGCGRCLTLCPVGMDITDLIMKVSQEAPDTQVV